MLLQHFPLTSQHYVINILFIYIYHIMLVYENMHVFDGARPEFPHHFLQREQENRVSSTQQEEEEEWEEIR